MASHQSHLDGWKGSAVSSLAVPKSRLLEPGSAGSPEAGPTRLDSLSVTVGENRPVCDRVRFDLLHKRTGVRVAGSCDTYACEVCGPRRMREWPFVLAFGAPERLLTLTLAPMDRARRRAQVRDLAYRLRKRGYRFEWAWNTELNPKRPDLCHVHLLQHGDYLPKSEVRAMWGGRFVDIRRLSKGERPADVGGLYLLKEGLDGSGYVMKESLSLDGRPVHMSRGYLRGFKVDEARRLIWLMRRPDSLEGDWVRVRREFSPEFLADATERRAWWFRAARPDPQ